MMWGIGKWGWEEWKYVYVRKLRQMTQIYIFSVPIQTVCMWEKTFSFLEWRLKCWFRVHRYRLTASEGREKFREIECYSEERMTNPSSSCRQGIQGQRVNNSRRGGCLNFYSELLWIVRKSKTAAGDMAIDVNIRIEMINKDNMLRKMQIICQSL